MFKKRSSRQQPRKREPSPLEDINATTDTEEGDGKVDLQELLALRKLQRTRQGIDAVKLSKGDIKKKRKPKVEGEEPGTIDLSGFGLQPQRVAAEPDEDQDLEDEEAKTRKLVRSNNFTQQTNALDVDKHMMAYIEENMKRRGGGVDDGDQEASEAPYDPHEELFRIDDRYKIQKRAVDEGNVTNSVAMLTAIPEVDLGMEARLKNIEETEKAKRAVADERRKRNREQGLDSEVASSRFFRPHQTVQSDADALRAAKLEAQGLPAEEAAKPRGDRKEMATDDLVMERFKKRMRR